MKTILLITTFLIGVICNCNAQEVNLSYDSFLFYNVENLFDTSHSSNTNDKEYTPQGNRHWNHWKLKKKLINIYKVIAASADPEIPSLIGFCEIENREVLNALLYETPLFQQGYKIVHFESPDRRGIDVALFYKSSKIKILEKKAISIKNPNDPSFRTRDILHIKIQYSNFDTINLYINHWPSRYGGYMQSQHKRLLTSSILRAHIDSIQNANSNANIIICGDFNDTKENESIKRLIHMNSLKTVPLSCTDQRIHGTHKFHNHWNNFDQFLISTSFEKDSSGIIIRDAEILSFPFLLSEDKKYGGIKPNRTFSGYKYLGGFSDHLPIILKFSIPYYE
ncbi:MAG: endonuclease [Bacteroidales bacterium]|nr:endonuclease [Bacteroidales bacterium]